MEPAVLLEKTSYHSAFPILTCLTLHIQDRLKIYLKPEANVEELGPIFASAQVPGLKPSRPIDAIVADAYLQTTHKGLKLSGKEMQC